MTPHEVQWALRLITSRQFRQRNYIPVTIIAAIAGLSRETLYQARNGKGLTHRVITTLSPVLSDVIAGRLRATWQAGYAVHRVTDREGQREERRFFANPDRHRQLSSSARTCS